MHKKIELRYLQADDHSPKQKSPSIMKSITMTQLV